MNFFHNAPFFTVDSVLQTSAPSTLTCVGSLGNFVKMQIDSVGLGYFQQAPHPVHREPQTFPFPNQCWGALTLVVLIRIVRCLRQSHQETWKKQGLILTCPGGCSSRVVGGTPGTAGREGGRWGGVPRVLQAHS